jgi:non-ribosomal peptide synthetase component E (peptide arylation enzyme)
MDNYLSAHATRNPCSIAIEDRSLMLTYNNLECEVDKLYSVLKRYNFTLEEPIYILEGVNA